MKMFRLQKHYERYGTGTTSCDADHDVTKETLWITLWQEHVRYESNNGAESDPDQYQIDPCLGGCR